MWPPIIVDSMVLYENPQLPFLECTTWLAGTRAQRDIRIFGTRPTFPLAGLSGCSRPLLKADNDSEQGSLAPKIAVLGVTHSKDLQHRLPPSELTATLNEPRNLGANFDRNVHFHHVTCLGPLGGVALDLIGVYLKNYEIDK